MPVTKYCVQCGVEFNASPSHAERRKCCSRLCLGKVQRTERRDIKCKTCGNLFNTPKDHGLWPKFCSRDCFLADCIHAEQRVCPICKKEFKATKSAGTGKLQVYCGQPCYAIAQKTSVLIPCHNCGVKVEVRLSRAKRAKRNFCSNTCRYVFIRGSHSPGWRGGSYIAFWSGHRMIAIESGFRAEHRIVAEKILGRRLEEREEPIIHLNGIQDDNRPSNLYIFHSMEEMGRVLNSTELPPNKSNLSPLTYR